jgi:short-subunit dehydrogenase
MRDWLRALFAGRPWWMNALMVFSAYMAFVYCPWDVLAKPAALDEDVWFGIRFHGSAAKFGGLLHWFVYAAGAYGFRKMRSWMWPWAAVYAGQVAFAMLVWNWLYVGGFLGFMLGIIAVIPFGLLTLVLWEARSQFEGEGRPPLRERYGEWGLVTGASAGIGAEFARALARDGVSVVLTARRLERLRELAAELEKNHQISTRVVEADLADPGAAQRLAEAVADLDLGVLVNNAGFGYSGRFDKLSPERLLDMVQVNCLAPVVLTSRVLPGMLERGRGAVIITGSVAGRQALPLHGVYSATKAFDQLFGESLCVEMRPLGVDVVVLEPGSTQTEFQQVAGEISHSGEPAYQVVQVALDALGRQPSVVSGWWNWLRANLATRLLPRSLVAYIARDVMAKQTPADMR